MFFFSQLRSFQLFLYLYTLQLIISINKQTCSNSKYFIYNKERPSLSQTLILNLQSLKIVSVFQGSMNEIYRITNPNHRIGKKSSFIIVQFSAQILGLCIFISRTIQGTIRIFEQLNKFSMLILKVLSKYDQVTNSIENVKGLTKIDSTWLQMIGLDRNDISQIRCLNKLSNQSMKLLCLNRQKSSFVDQIIDKIQNGFNSTLSSIRQLTRFKMDSTPLSPSTSLLHTTARSLQPNETSICADLSLLMKLNSKAMKGISVEFGRRIMQPKINVMLKKNFHQYLSDRKVNLSYDQKVP